MNSIKEKLIERIKLSKDENLLNEIYNLLESTEQEPIIFSKNHINKVQESEEAYSKGNIISDEDLQKKLNKWLGE